MGQDEQRTGEQTIPPKAENHETATPPGELHPGQSLGRYRIKEKIGAGGMGVVYAAYDESLDRQVAIKLLKPDTAGEDLGVRQDRLLREARAMAQLSNPNVNTVHEVGTHQGQLYLVMELVDGQTLGTWLGQQSRTWQEVVDAFIQAGRGLAAAHRAGLIHRDIKPDNLLVGSDGRVRVTDFGLVSSPGAAVAQAEPNPGHSTGDEVSLTYTGARLGSPAYMSPEQHEGRKLTAASDQFSFCVTLFEALYGQRPFLGDSMEEISARIQEGVISDAPGGSIVPGRLGRDAPPHLYAALRRGLDPNPEHRFADMELLLLELGRDPARTRKRILAWSGVLLGLAAGITALALNLWSTTEPPCVHADRHLQGIWDQASRSALATAFHQTGLGHAPATWLRVKRAVDGYSADWVRARREACEATQVHREQSVALMDLRMRCLDRQLAQLKATLRVLAKPDLEVVNRSVQAVSQLGDLAICADGDKLSALSPRPTDAAAQSALAEVETLLSDARAQQRAGRYDRARGLAQKAVDRAEQTGYRPVQAESQLALGDSLMALKKLDAAEQALRAAIQAAEAGHHDRVAARSWIGLVNTTGNLKGKLSEGQTLADYARAAIERLGGDESLRSDLLLYEGRMHHKGEDFSNAQALIEEALKLRTGIHGPDHLRVAAALSYLAAVVRKRTATEDDPTLMAQALAAQRRCLKITRKALGDGHPRTAQAMSNLAAVLDWAKKPEESLDLQRQALDIWSKALPGDHPALANAYNRMASAHLTAGRVKRAIALMELALEVRTKAFGPDNPMTADIHFNLGVLHNQLGKQDEAQTQFERAASGYQTTQGPKSAKGAMALYAVCGMLRMKGQLEAGLDRCQRSLAIWKAAGGKHKAHMARTLVAIGQAQLGLNRPAEAIAPLDEAIALHGQYQPPPLEVAEAQFELARALWDGQGDRARSRTLATKAWRFFKEKKKAPAEQGAEVQAWCRARKIR